MSETSSITAHFAAGDEEVEASIGANPLFDTPTYSAYELPFKRDGLSIYGQLFVPKKDKEGTTLDLSNGISGLKKLPVVVVQHGFGSCIAHSAPDARILASHGIAAYAFDFCGGGVASRSDGSMLNLSILTEVADLRAVCDGLEVTGVADSSNLFILGRSMSGVVSSIFAARQPEDLAGLILYYPAFNMPGTADKYRGIDEIPEKSLAMDNRRVVGRAFYADMFGMNPFDAARAYEGDVLIVHGDQDTTVPFEWSERAAKEYAHAKLVKVPGARHGFQGEHQKIALAAVEKYVWEHFTPRA